MSLCVLHGVPKSLTVTHVSLLLMMISPLPDSDTAFLVSPSRYPEPPVPALADPAPAFSVPLRVVNALPSRDLFPAYTMSPAHSVCAPATSPVTTDVLDTSKYISPGSPAAMDRFLAGDDDLLLDCSSNLPMLPLTFLPLTGSGVLPPESVVAHSPVDQFPSSAAASPDLSREGPFDAGQSVSVSGAAPLVLDSLPGCQYQMT